MRLTIDLKMIVEAFASSVANLQAALDAERDKTSFSRNIWKAFDKLEYALFLHSLIHQNNLETQAGKSKLTSKEFDVKAAVNECLNLLKDAKNNIENKNSNEEALKKAWKARDRLLKIQSFLEKQRKKERNHASTSLPQ